MLSEFQNELLASAVGLMLHLPKEALVALGLPAILPAIQAGIDLGRSHLPVARIVIESFERFLQILPVSACICVRLHVVHACDVARSWFW